MKAVFALALPLLAQNPPDKAAAKPVRPTQQEIDQAIDSGAQYLIRSQSGDGSWAMGPADLSTHAYANYMGPQTIGLTALALLTILDADVDPEHEAIQRGFKFLLDNRDKFEHTYNCAIALMALEAYAEKGFKKWREQGAKQAVGIRGKDHFLSRTRGMMELARELAVRLVKGQLEDGSWTYGAHSGTVRSGTGVEGQDGGGGAGGGRPPFPPQFAGLGGDLSNTQYALLGLRAAAELGIRVDTNVWFKAVGCFLERQEKDGPKVAGFPVPAATDQLWGDMKAPRRIGSTGVQERRSEFKARGWGYTVRMSRPAAYGAMTTIGVASVVICKYYLRGHPGLAKGDLLRRIDESIEDGCAWIEQNFSVKDNIKWVGDGPWVLKNDPPKIDGYYMYGVERAGVLGGVDYFGTKDWYGLGARRLVDQQQKDGSWSSDMAYEPKPAISTCFAVLFLKRATKPMIESHSAGEIPKAPAGEEPRK